MRNRKRELEKLFTKMLILLNCDLKDDDLRETPQRLAKLYLDELFQSNFSQLSNQKKFSFQGEFKRDQIVEVNGINIKSICAHHFLPIYGHAKIRYIPKDFYFGLSKFHRVIDFFCKKPQTQEKLTQEIFDYFVQKEGIKHFEIEIIATHFCVHFRGVENENSQMRTFLSTNNFFFNKI